MREIKFRYWDGENMIDGDSLAFEEYAPISHLLTREGTMQYTGLKDKNGIEIYEGDIVNVNHFGGTPRYENVKFYTNAGFAGIHPFTDSGHHWASKKCEVIGNIYENPELFNA